MVDAVTRQAAHVPPVVLPANPFTVSALTPVTHQTGLICFGCAQGGRISSSRREFCPGTILGVLIAVAVTGLTLRAARIAQEPGALTVSVKRKSLHDQPVTLLAVFANYCLLSSGSGRCLRYKIRRFCFSSRFMDPDSNQTDCGQSKKNPWNESSSGS